MTISHSGPLDVHMKHAATNHEQLQQIANGFEEVFIRNFLKTARQSMPGGGCEELFGSNARDQFESMMDEQMARDLAGRLGVADHIVKQLEEYLPDSSPKAADTTAADSNTIEDREGATS